MSKAATKTKKVTARAVKPKAAKPKAAKPKKPMKWIGFIYRRPS